jgi:hypothetical protein
MILTAHQPVYIPWLGLFHKIYLAEKFCIFDIAQYQTKDYNNRNLIKTHQDAIWLTVPVESKDHFQKKLCDIKIVNDGWNKKHIKSIQLAYQKTKYFKEYFDGLQEILIGRRYEFLTDLNSDVLKFMLKSFGINIPIVKASDYDFKGIKSDLVMDMCLKLKADKYIFGSQGKDYADVEKFKENNIKVYFQDYKHPEYNQLHGIFKPFMSALDLLFNEGPNSLEILMINNDKSIK